MKQSANLHNHSWKAMGEVALPDEVEHFLFALIMNTLGLSVDSRWRLWLRRFLGKTVRGVAEKAAAFDESVGRLGFQASASQWIYSGSRRSIFVGEENLPVDSTIINRSHHPGRVR